MKPSSVLAFTCKMISSRLSKRNVVDWQIGLTTAVVWKRGSCDTRMAFVLNRMTGKGSIGRDTAVTASVDTFALSKAMSKQKTVEVGNARTVGKAIAGEILKAYNPRRA